MNPVKILLDGKTLELRNNARYICVHHVTLMFFPFLPIAQHLGGLQRPFHLEDAEASDRLPASKWRRYAINALDITLKVTKGPALTRLLNLAIRPM